jgi:hypothetical protein
VNRALLALLASFVVASVLGESPEPARIRITTWNLEWFPNGSAHDATPEVQAQRIAAAADVLRPIDPDIILLQEVRDYEACSRLGEAIASGIYHLAICSAFKEPFQSGLGKQQVGWTINASPEIGRRSTSTDGLSVCKRGSPNRCFPLDAPEIWHALGE